MAWHSQKEEGRESIFSTQKGCHLQVSQDFVRQSPTQHLHFLQQVCRSHPLSMKILNGWILLLITVVLVKPTANLLTQPVGSLPVRGLASLGPVNAVFISLAQLPSLTK